MNSKEIGRTVPYGWVEVHLYGGRLDGQKVAIPDNQSCSIRMLHPERPGVTLEYSINPIGEWRFAGESEC